MTQFIENPIIEQVMNDNSWEYEDGLLDGYSPGELRGAIGKALKIQREQFERLIDEDSSLNYSVPESIDIFKNKLKATLKGDLKNG